MLSSFGILGITASECTKLIGVGTDGAPANIAAGRRVDKKKELLCVHTLDEVFSSTVRIACSRCFEGHYV